MQRDLIPISALSHQAMGPAQATWPLRASILWLRNKVRTGVMSLGVSGAPALLSGHWGGACAEPSSDAHMACALSCWDSGSGQHGGGGGCRRHCGEGTSVSPLGCKALLSPRPFLRLSENTSWIQGACSRPARVYPTIRRVPFSQNHHSQSHQMAHGRKVGYAQRTDDKWQALLLIPTITEDTSNCRVVQHQNTLLLSGPGGLLSLPLPSPQCSWAPASKATRGQHRHLKSESWCSISFSLASKQLTWTLKSTFLPVCSTHTWHRNGCVILTGLIWPFPNVHRYQNTTLHIINTFRVFFSCVIFKQNYFLK